MWQAEVEIFRKDKLYTKKVLVCVGKDDTEQLRWNPAVLRMALKYSGYSKTTIGDIENWKIKQVIIIKKIGLW